MYSQNDEETVILNYFKDSIGRFLDIGANDGKNCSNTAALIEKDWHGVMVEPAPLYFRELLKNYHQNPNLTLVNCALGTKDCFEKFHYTEMGGISTFDDKRRDTWAKECGDFKDYYLPIISVTRFLETFPGPYHFLNLDTEGMDANLIEAIPLDGFSAVCIEYNQYDSERITNRMTQTGFHKIYTSAENYIFVR